MAKAVILPAIIDYAFAHAHVCLVVHIGVPGCGGHGPHGPHGSYAYVVIPC